jgi:hypothetical protein
MPAFAFYIIPETVAPRARPRCACANELASDLTPSAFRCADVNADVRAVYTIFNFRTREYGGE